MTSITKKIYLETQYKQFTKEIESIMKINLFPSLDDIDMVDILMFFQYTFFCTNDYEEIVKNLIETHHQEIDDETFNKIYPIVEKYIVELKKFLQTN
jgi:hypothetical protein